MKNFFLLFSLLPALLFGADTANDVVVAQRNSGNTGFVQRNLPGTANSLMGFNGSSVASTITAGSGITISGGVISATGGGSGTVTSVGFTGGLISVATATTTPAFTVAGTSGGIPYFSSASTWASSAALAANSLVIGGGAGVAPSTTTTGANILTFLGTPSSANLALAVTNETGTGLLVFATDPTFTLTDVTTNNASTSQHGWLPKLGGGTTNFLRADGTWAAPSGSGTVSVVGAGTLTSTAIVTGGGTQLIQTPSATATLDSSGNISTPGGISTGVGGSVAGYYAWGQGTATVAPTSSVGLMAPASVTTKFMMILPGAPSTGVMLNTGSTDPSTISFIAPSTSGNVLTSNGTTWVSSAATGGTPANPTATIGLTAVNGSASTYLRSDGAPALSQAIAPTWTGVHIFTPTARSSGSASYFTLTTPADTSLTASTESIGASFTAATRQWATGALTTQRERVFAAPTYGFVGASTLTTAINVDIADPIAGTNATLTNKYGLRVNNQQITGTLTANTGTNLFGPFVDSVDGITPLNNIIQTIATGTAYTMTTSSAALDFGTTDPVITIANAGTYAVYVTTQLSFVGTTFATPQSATFKLRRTNNTAADLTGSSFSAFLPALTTTTDIGPSVTVGPIKYTTTNTNDSVTVFGILSGATGAGSVTASDCTITAIRMY